MRTYETIYNSFSRLWVHINSHRRKQFGLLLILMLLVSFAEMLSIGSVLPFLSILSSPEHIFALPAMQPLIQILNLTEAKQLLLPLTIAFGFSTFIAGSMRLLLLWATTKLSYATGADLSMSIYQRTLYQPYAVHCSRNSSEVISSISTKVNSVISVITMLLTLISSAAILTTILFILISINPIIALATFGTFGLIYLVIIRLTRQQQLINGERIARESTQVIKSLQEGLGGIRDILIDGTQATYCKVYSHSDLLLRRAQASSSFIAASPRYLMESIGMLIIAALAYFLASDANGITKAIPVLGVLALGAQRLLPVLQQAYASWVGIKSYQLSLQDALELLDQPLPDFNNQLNINSLGFKRYIKLNQIAFRYHDNSPFIINGLDFCIPKGSRIGFIGATGSGKSTLVDIIMGLLTPTNGSLEIDDQVITANNCQSWQSHIAHVPQVIFLADCTVEENIAFGVPKKQIDIERVKKAAQQAQLSSTIESWPNQYQTFVGERGVRLSGGQRQRIGIARALYKEADVIIFDEATSALDNETEQAVMEVIEGLNKDLTLLIIAHRLTTLKNCTQIVEIADGGINQIESYSFLVNKA
jgi:ABC-type multidrug transport system fused ATPase/permease subunit